MSDELFGIGPRKVFMHPDDAAQILPPELREDFGNGDTVVFGGYTWELSYYLKDGVQAEDVDGFICECNQLPKEE